MPLHRLRAIIRKEFALSGSEQNPDLTAGGWLDVLKNRRGAILRFPKQNYKPIFPLS